MTLRKLCVCVCRRVDWGDTWSSYVCGNYCEAIWLFFALSQDVPGLKKHTHMEKYP